MRSSTAAVALGMVLSLTGAASAAEREQVTKQGVQARAEVSQIAVDPATSAKIHRAPVVTGGAPALIDEVEPNDTPATAQALPGTPVRVRGSLYRAPFVAGDVDVDVYSFTAPAGARFYAATMTSFSGGSGDTVLDLLDVDGTTVIETDDEDGSLNANASVIAGAQLTTGGTYYIRVRQFGVASLTGTIRPYDLYVRVLTGTPTPEVEPNNNGQAPNPLPPDGWVSGTINPASPADNDTFSVAANAGDTIVAIVDADPERDAPDWNPRLGIGVFNGFLLVVDGANADTAPAEAIFMTVKTTNTYVIYLDTNAAGAGPAATYHLSVSVIPARTHANCTTYTGTGGAITDAGTTDFTLNIPDVRSIDYLRVNLNATHTNTADLDVSLISPDGNEVLLFDDPPNAAGAAAPQINLTLEDEGALPISTFGVHSGMIYSPELLARLSYFQGMQAQGNWILRVRDDLATQTGTLNSWGLEVCEPAPRPACLVPGPNENTIYASDFESDDGGFTHSGTQDEWERGLPAFVPITTAHSGVNAWKTDLDNTYNASSNQDLVSPNINLTAATGRITLNWWHKFSMESASFDSYWVEVRQVGVPSNARRVFSWTGATMNRAVGVTPAVTIQEAAGWARQQVDISSFAGMNVEVVFHVDSDTTVNLTGVAVDDVSVTSCTTVVGQAVSNLGITKTDGQGTYFPGEQLTYTIVMTNGGPSAVTGATVADAFPAALTNVTWTCTASSGSSCTASGTGDINDAAVNLLNGGTATYTALATVSNTATGDITNSATATVPGGWTDPDTANNSASDTDQLVTFAPLGLKVDDAGNKVFEPGETVVVAPIWTNNGAAAFGLTGTLTNHTGPFGGGTYDIPDPDADYGTIAAGGNGACTDCYSVSASATTRPVAHWDSTVLETTNTLNSKTWTLHIGNSFGDVTTASPFYRFVETIFHNGVTTGCAADSYCPASPTSRDQMAVFVLVSKEGPGYSPAACGTPVFNDVPASSPFCKYIEELVRRGVVAGCNANPPLYCPGTATTREQMSIFVLRTLDSALDPPACVAGSERFDDVPASSPFCKWIEELARRGVVTGCTATSYCPTGNVSREQMAVFLAATFGLELYGL